jgi:hypothetical protein
MDRPTTEARATAAREALWKFVTAHGPALVNHEYFLVNQAKWWDDPRSKDAGWKTDLVAPGKLLVSRITLEL